MKIWFDISNSPHVLMFYKLIRQLENEGHTIIITARPLANTISLLEQYGLKYETVGIHYGKKIRNKIIGYPVRVIQLYKHLKNKNLDLAVSQSSFHSPMVATLLRIPSIYTNDNEHALGNKIAFLFASKILIPESFPFKNKMKHTYVYPGIKEGMYLWDDMERFQYERKSNISQRDTIYIRPEPSTAQYYNAQNNFLDDLILNLSSRHKIVVLTRNEQQNNHYKKLSTNIIVPEKPLPIDIIIKKGKLFIGAGGTMTRELALLGIPTVSVYQSKLLKVDELLIEYKILFFEPQLTSDKVDYILNNRISEQSRITFKEKGKEAFYMFKHKILEYA